MITRFNRKEVFVTSDVIEQLKVVGALKSHRIPYVIHVKRGTSMIVDTHGSKNCYVVYVSKRNYKVALDVVKGVGFV